jgi:hypothetical protein
MLAAVSASTQRLIGLSQKTLRNVLPGRHSNRVVVRQHGILASFVVCEVVLPRGARRIARLDSAPRAGGSAVFSNGFLNHSLVSARARTTLCCFRRVLRPHFPVDSPSLSSGVGKYRIRSRFRFAVDAVAPCLCRSGGPHELCSKSNIK